MALGLRLAKRGSRVFVELSDGELQEGATWEAAMAGSHFQLDSLVAIIDCNGIQADGPMVLAVEPVAEKWKAFGWDTQEIDGNDLAAILEALRVARATNRRPKAIVARTVPGRGVPLIEGKERAHFVRLERGEWDQSMRQLESAHD